MKFNPAAFAGGAVVGGAISGNTGDGYEFLPTVAGMAIGGGAANAMDFKMPRGTFDSTTSVTDFESGVKNYKPSKSDKFSDLSDVLTNFSKGVEGDHAFDPANPVSSITETNLKSALRFYEEMSSEELQRTLTLFKEGESARVKLDPTAMENDTYKVIRDFSTADATLDEKKEKLMYHLEKMEHQNIPDVNKHSELHAARAQRVEELAPFLDRLEGNIIFEDGQLRGTLNNTPFTLPLTQTLTDGITEGHTINNNVYTSHKFNVMGSVIASGAGSTPESAAAVANQLGLQGGTVAHDTAVSMLADRAGASREATLGMLASMPKVTDQSLLAAVDRLSEKTQWDEAATSRHIEAMSDLRNGLEYDPDSLGGRPAYESTPYTKSQSQLIDMTTTLKHDGGNFGDMSETALRNVRTSTDSTHPVAESHQIRRQMKFLGEDRVSGVKADHSLIFTPHNNSEGGLVNLNAPYNRNAGTVTNRALQVSVVEGSESRYGVDALTDLFGGKSQLGSAIKLQTALFDEEKVAPALSEFLGGNVTLDDGYALGNRSSFEKLEHTGYTKVKIQSGRDGTILARSPMINHLAEGQLNVSEVKELADAGLAFKGPRATTLERANKNFAIAAEYVHRADVDAEDLLNVGSLLDSRYKGLSKMMSGIYHSVEKDLKDTVYEGDTPAKQLAAMRQGVVDYFARRTSIGDHTQTTDYGIGLQTETDADLYNARANFLRTGDMEQFNADLSDAIDTYSSKRAVLKDAVKTVYPRGGSVIGYGISGEAQRVSKSYDRNELVDLQQRVDNQGRVSLEATYKGTTNLGSSDVVKTFSVNYKDQTRLLDSSDFITAGKVAEYMLDGTLVRNGPNNYTINLNGKTYENLTPAQVKTNLLDDTSLVSNAKLASKYSSVDTISSLSGAGYGNQDAVQAAIRTGVDADGILPKSMMETVNAFSEKSRQGASTIGGLTDFVYATSNEKPALAALLENANKGQEALASANRLLSEGSIDKQSYKDIVGKYGENLSVRGSTDKIINTVQSNFDASMQALAASYNTEEGVYALQTDASVRKAAAETFVANSQMADKVLSNMFTDHNYGANVHMGVVAINRKAETETGAGTLGKSMSWNAQSQLLANGFTTKDLDAVASFDQSAVNDAVALTGMTRKHDPLLTQYLNDNPSAIRNTLTASPEDRRKVLQDAFGYKPEGNVDFYNLSYKPESGIKSVPIIYDASRNFDSYVDGKDTGAKKSKRINSLLSNIIETDVALSQSSDAAEIKLLQGKLDVMHASLEKALTPTLGGSSGSIKAALTRHGDASRLSTVGAINGNFSTFVDSEMAKGHSGSLAAVSASGAVERLKQAGIELSDSDIAQIHLGTSPYLESVEGFDNLKRIKVDANNPLFGFINREPAQGPMSIRGVEYVMDSSLQGTEDLSSSIFIRHKDPFYKFLQFGDYDFDTMTEYFAKDLHKSNPAQYAAMVERARGLAKDYSKLISFADKLGVKNNKSNKMKSLFDILEENPNITTYKEWHEKYLDSIYDDTTKAGLRKTISPKVTMLAASLNNSLLSASDDLSTNSIQGGRVLTHYFVENLLKAQHSSGSGIQETVAEQLHNLRSDAVKSGNKSAYLDALNTALTDQLKNIKPDSDEYKLGQDAIKAIVSAERIHMSSSAANPMDIGGAMINKTFAESLDIARGVLEGDNQAINLHAKVEGEMNLAASSKIGYDRTKKAAKQLFENNKKILAASAIGIAGVALAFRNNPEESYSQSTSADVGRQTLAPNKQQHEPVQGVQSGKGSEYITPHRDAKRAVTVEGQYTGNEDAMRENSRKSVFGDNIDSAQVEYRED